MPMKSVAQTTIVDMAIGVAVLALLCSIPVQCRRAMEADGNRVMAEYHAEMARYLAELGNKPDAWVEEFRGSIRRLGDWEQGESQRLADASFFKAPTADPAAGAGMPYSEIRQLWARFDRIALQHAYRRPRPNWPPPRGSKPLTLFGALASCAPTFVIATGFAWLLVRRRKRQLDRSTPAAGLPGTGPRGHRNPVF
jgi:hypothetical protein